MTVSRIILSAAVLTCLLAAPAAADSINLPGSEWGFGDRDKRSIQFASGGRVSGHAGCNRFAGTYVQRGERLRLSRLVTTMMACPPAAMRAERAFLTLLERVRSYRASHLRLTLYGPGRAKLADLRRRDFD